MRRLGSIVTLGVEIKASNGASYKNNQFLEQRIETLKDNIIEATEAKIGSDFLTYRQLLWTSTKESNICGAGEERVLIKSKS